MKSSDLPIGVPPGECPTCGDQGASIDHIKTCRKFRAADPSELDEIRRMQMGYDWAQNWPLVSFDRFADWRED